jgi:alpha-beta hydrolase superfamily lysophospholipase
MAKVTWLLFLAISVGVPPAVLASQWDNFQADRVVTQRWGRDLSFKEYLELPCRSLGIHSAELDRFRTQKKLKDVSRIAWPRLPKDQDWFKRVPPPRGVVWLVHGLNTLPEQMTQWSEVLQSSGYAVVRVSLSGHRGDLEEMRSATPEQWLADFHTARCLGHGEFPHAPTHVLSYSLGALVVAAYIKLQAQDKTLQVSSQTLLAPALELRDRSFLIQIMNLFGERNLIGSQAPKAYRANVEGTSMAAYNALFELHKFVQGDKTLANVPTQVWIDPKDELVSHSKLQRLVSDPDFEAAWELNTIEKDKGVKGQPFHLLLNSENLGPVSWERIRSETVGFIDKWNLARRPGSKSIKK